MVEPEREIRRLHEVIAAWFRGETDDLAPFADALAPEFEIISPDGTRRDRDAVIAGMREVHGSRADDPGFAIEIRNVERRAAPGEGHLVRYEEHQRTDGDWRGRTSTVLLAADDDAPAGRSWVHLHETWLPG